MVFFFSLSSTSMVLAGAQSVPSSSPITLAPWKAGNTRAFHRRKFPWVKTLVGGCPRAAASMELDEDELIVKGLGFFGGGGGGRIYGGGYRVLVFSYV